MRRGIYYKTKTRCPQSARKGESPQLTNSHGLATCPSDQKTPVGLTPGEVSRYRLVAPALRQSFYLLLPSPHALSFSSLTALAWPSTEMRSGRSGVCTHPCSLPSLGEETPSLPPLRKMSLLASIKTPHRGFSWVSILGGRARELSEWSVFRFWHRYFSSLVTKYSRCEMCYDLINDPKFMFIVKCEFPNSIRRT